MFKIFPASIRPNINWHFSLLTSQDLASNNNEELLKMEFYEKKKCIKSCGEVRYPERRRYVTVLLMQVVSERR